MAQILRFPPLGALDDPAEWLELQAENIRKSGETTGVILVVIQDDEIDTGWNGLRSREELLQAVQTLMNEAMGCWEDDDEEE